MSPVRLIIICTLLFLLPNSDLYAQDDISVFEISGIVLDRMDSTPIPFAFVSLLDSVDSSLVQGVQTDLDGLFLISQIKLEPNYLIKINFLGYADKFVLLDVNEHEKIDLGTIYISVDEYTLDEVEIVANKLPVERTANKLTYNTNEFDMPGNNALDILSVLPSIHVDENDIVNFRGDANVIIQLNGKTIEFQRSSLLKSISSSSIVKIEVIANPSAKYDAAGMNGIINIITDNTANKGFHSSTNLTLAKGINLRKSFSQNLKFGSEKLGLVTNYSFNDYKRNHNSYTERELLDGQDLIEQLSTVGSNTTNNKSHLGILGIDYFISEDITVYFSSNVNTTGNGSRSNILYDNSLWNYNSIRSTLETGEVKNWDFNVGAQLKLGYDNSIDFDISATNNKNIVFEEIDEIDFLQSNLLSLTHTFNNSNNAVAKVDCLSQMNETAKLEYGLKYSSLYNSNDFSLDVDNADISIDSSYISKFNYTQSIFASYIEYTRDVKKLSYNIGLRLENENTVSRVESENMNMEKTTLNLFPSASISYELKNQTNISFNYSKRINRPMIAMLNPASFFSDKYIIERGNPFLNSELIHALEIAFSRSTKVFNIDASVSYRNLKNKTRRYLRQENELSVITYKNLESTQLLGINLNLHLKPVSFLNVYYNLNVWNYRTKDNEITNGNTVNSINSIMNLDFYFNLKNNLKFYLLNYLSPRYQLQQGYMLPKYTMGVGISKQFLEKKLKLKLAISDALNTLRSYFRSANTVGYNFRGDWDWETRLVYLSMNWNFGSENAIKRRRKTIDKSASGSGEPNGF